MHENLKQDNVRILVVEDEAITAMDIQKQLQKLGYLVPTISDTGADAIRVAREEQPNIILMDIVLKGDMDGTQTAQEISKIYNVPIIFLTAFKDEKSFSRAKESNPYAYLSKPYDIRDLHNAIELALFKHNAEAKISAAEQRYRSVMENATCGIVISQLDGTIMDTNKQAEKILGCDRQQLINVDIKQFFLTPDRSYLEIQTEKLLRDKVIDLTEHKFQRLDNAIRDVDYTAVYIENEKDKFILSIFNDITERKRLLAQSLLSDKLATIGTLAAGIIHEINNPLAYVISNLDTAQNMIDTKKERFSSEQPEQLELIGTLSEIHAETLQGVIRIRDIIQNLKSFARTDTEELDIVNLHDILNSTIKMTYSQYKNHVKLETDFAADMPMMMLNKNKLHQVFMNLIINASQAMEGRPYDKNTIIVKSYFENNQVCVDIHDTGKGIPKDIQAKIFEPFFTTKPIGVGTGLGLSICSDIINSMKGKLKVVSEVDKGTTFTVRLPIHLIMEKPVLTDENPVAIKISRILIIDDDPTLLTTLDHILGKDYQITKAQSGRIACEILEKHMDDFDLIISDLQMPEVNGADIYRYIANRNQELANRMMFITGNANDKKIIDSISASETVCLEKPFTKDQLLLSMKKVLH